MQKRSRTRSTRIHNRMDLLSRERGEHDTCRVTDIPVSRVWHLPLFSVCQCWLGNDIMEFEVPVDYRWARWSGCTHERLLSSCKTRCITAIFEWPFRWCAQIASARYGRKSVHQRAYQFKLTDDRPSAPLICRQLRESKSAEQF